LKSYIGDDSVCCRTIAPRLSFGQTVGVAWTNTEDGWIKRQPLGQLLMITFYVSDPDFISCAISWPCRKSTLNAAVSRHESKDLSQEISNCQQFALSRNAFKELLISCFQF